MLPAGASAIYLYRDPVDMRKGFDGLGGLVESSFPGRLCTSAAFVFVNRRRTLVKILQWEGDGFAIWYKRLELGTFPRHGGGSLIDRRTLAMLLEGVIPKRVYRRYKKDEKTAR